jgi:translocation and assembly module TamB
MLILSRMKYAEDINLERQLLDFTRRAPTPRVVAKNDPLVHFNVDVHLSRGVRIENNLARTDLKGEFTLTGTSRRPGLLGSVNTVHGTASFRGNEFQIEQGVINFTDRQSIRPSFDLQALSTVKDYKILLHAFGTPQDPRVSLTSEPALAESDLAFLLTFGFVQQNIQAGAVNAADTGTAIALEALNKVTGFSEEVRRFIPKNAILRNPTFDFTSDFSLASNRVEAMARFHSQFLTEKLDLRILQGLSTRRGRGVISYRLSEALTAQGSVDNEHLSGSGIGTDLGLDLSLRWEGN